MRLYVLDAALEPCAVGVVGELYVAGAGLARGYWHRAGLTAQRFIANPYSASPGERLYRSGDLAAWRADGNLVFHGRADNQVKIRGYRLELGEIEAALSSSGTVAQAVVLPLKDETGETRLAAYVVPTEIGLDLAQLRAHLAARLPEYMIPGSFVLLDELPLTRNGKLDRAALAAIKGRALTRGYVAPRTPEEIVLCELVARLLGLERVGLTDHFFHLGGHSLLATRLAAQIRARLGRELPIRTIFDVPVLGELARALRTLPKAGAPLRAMARQAEPSLSFAQTRLWFLHRLEGANANYSIALGLRLKGVLDVAALELGLGDVVARHESLRTLLIDQDGEPRQLILAAHNVTVALRVVRSSTQNLQEDLAAASAHGFALAEEIPFKATLFELGADEHALLLLIHHSAADGWSMAPLSRDLALAYGARRQGRAPDFAPLPVQYADYALWQRELLGAEQDTGSALARQIGYWREQLADLPAELNLPTDRARPHSPSYAGGAESIRIEAALHARLRALASEHNSTLFMLLQAALAALFTKLGAGHDIPIGAPIAGRSEAALDELVGFFVNTLVLRTDTSADPSALPTCSRALATRRLEAYAHQELPFERLVELLDPPRAFGRQPLFQTMLVLQNEPPPRFELAGLSVSELRPTARSVKFDLCFSFTELEDAAGLPAELRGELEYSTDLYDASTAERLVERLVRVLEQVSADPGVALHRLQILSAAERAQVLEGFNATTTLTPALRGRTLVELWEAQVARSPQSVALKCGEEELSYAALEERANQVAWHLIGAAIGPEDRVGIYLERSAALLIGVLGTLKSGAAYVPLEVHTLGERLAFMLEDAGPRALLTSEALVDRLPEGYRGDVLALDEATLVAALEPLPRYAPDDADRRTPLRPEHPAYLIYTSGSSGTPKGVAITQGSIAHYIELMGPSWERTQPACRSSRRRCLI